MKRETRRACAGLCACLLAGAAARAEEPQDWSLLAQNDLRFIHDSLAKNHPGPVDPYASRYKTWFEAGFPIALDLAERADTPAGYYFALMRYVNGFQDGHTALRINEPLNIQWSAPGFAVARFMDPEAPYFAVAAVERPENSPPIGARLVSCDGKDPETLLNERVGAFLQPLEPEARRYQNASYLLYDADNPFIERPKTCVFRVNGAEKTFPLHWTPTKLGGHGSMRDEIVSFQPLNNGIEPLADRGYWITMSRLMIDDEAPGGAAAMSRLVEDFKSEPERFRNAQVLVFDLRSNTGGSGQWIAQAAAALWGEAYVEALTPRGDFTDYRVSRGNYEYFKELYEAHFSDPNAPYHDYVRAIVEGLAQALEKGDALWTHPATIDVPSTDEAPPNPVRAKVYVLTDYSCASACLDTADALLALGAVQIGLPTSGDTFYLEVREVDLPSGLGHLWVSMNAHRGRLRGWNEPHTPRADRIWAGDINDSAALKNWVLSFDKT